VADSNPCCVDAERTRGRARDRGESLIEILISVVLLGMGVTALLSTLMVTIEASATERDHANAHAWLQSASDVLYRYERKSCSTYSAADIATEYQTEIRAHATNPENWPAGNIEIVPPVLFWNGDIYQDICWDSKNVNLQLITIRVRNLDGRIVEEVQVVKG
jgi:type II secretory pathway pseudopilin PulG